MDFGLGKSRVKEHIVWHIVFFVALVILVGVEFIYNQKLIDLSEEIMLYLQEKETEGGRIFFKWVSNIGLGVPYFLGAFIVLNWNSERGRSYYHFLFLATALVVVSVTKMAYAQARLFWYVYAIMPLECTTDYGNPSGHTFLAIAYPMLVYLDFFENKRR